ncbi:acyl-homoserine-lactone synthase [Lentilitoribacter sp. EG35]|uniref:acyl-homoserine-lactone synthase n=1 Tax=Lentilitoribacter sp. EG35 TaxID=3234192 RepID=UPI003460D93B
MGRLRTIIVNWSNMVQYSSEWVAHHRLRKAVFIDKAGWEMPVCDGLEFDQYDTAYSNYVIVLNEKNECVGCARMMPTNVRIGLHTYMIKDACDGKLDGIPSGILDIEPPVDGHEWEATRYTIDPNVGMKDAKLIMDEILISMKEFARSKDITRFIGLMPTGVYRMFKRAGHEVDIIGPVIDIDNRKTAVAYMPV